MKRSYFLLFMLWPFFSIGQNIPFIKGRIINEDGQPVPSATIRLKNTNLSAVSDATGQFTIHSPRLTDTIIVTATGYQPTEESGNDLNLIIIVLKRKATTMQEVTVNTGYEELPKERATGSFEKISTALLDRSASSNILDHLEGVSSIYFDRRSIGDGDISIRGRSTIFGNAAPLVVVDNVPYDGFITNLNPDDIESVTILKDAAAASIWGVKAGNGVIVITTKKGRYNQTPLIEFNTNITIGNKPDLWYAPAISPADFIDVEKMLFNNGFYDGDISNTVNNPPLTPAVELLLQQRNGQISAQELAAGLQQLGLHDVRNDLDKYFYRHSMEQQYMLSCSGGSEKINYRFSAGYDKQLPYAVKNSSNRLNLRNELVFSPVKSLELTTILSYTTSGSSFNGSRNISIGYGKNIYPYAQLAGEQGDPMAIIKDYRLGYLDTVGGGQLLDWKYRPLQELNLADNHSRITDLRLNIGAKYKIIPHLSADILYQFEKQEVNGRNLYSQDTYTARNLINYFYDPAASNQYGIPLGGILDISKTELVSHSARGQLNYQRVWKNLHDLAFITGAEIRQSRSGAYNFRTYGYDDDRLTFGSVDYTTSLPIYADLSFPQPVPNPASFSEGVLRFVSLYGNGSYTYNNKYILSASVRKDASNLFGVSSNQRGVPLWSSGLSWQLGKEKFYHIKWLPYLKLRATYGYNGNTDNNLSAFTTIRYSTGALFTRQPYASVQNPPNPKLRWEKQSVLNFGADFATVNKRIEGSIDYYIKKGMDLIGDAPLDPTTGVLSNLGTFSFSGNVARMRGKGLEAQLSTLNLTGAFTWNTDLLFNYADNKVTSYAYTGVNAGAYLSLGNIVNPIPGKPLYTIYSYKWAGLDPNTGDPRGYLNGQVSNDYASLVNVTADELNYHGSAIPVIFGSLRNTFGYKGVALSFNLVYKLGYYFRRSSIDYSALFNNWSGHPDFAMRWQKPGDELHTNVPSMIYPDPTSDRDFFYSSSSVLVEKGDHIRFQDISLSWDIKRSWLHQLHLKDTRVYTYINNIGILWKANKAGLDPDYFVGGFPLPRTFAIGFKTSF